MKKAVCILLVCIMALSLFAGCGKKAKTVDVETLKETKNETKKSSGGTEETAIQTAAELTERIDAMAGNTDYLKSMSMNMELLDLADSLGEGSHKSPESALIIRIDYDALIKMIKEYEGDDDADDVITMLESDDALIANHYRKNFTATLPQMLLNAYGVNMIAATSMLTDNKIFASDLNYEDGWIVFLFYDKGGSSVTTLYSENGAVSANAKFFPGDKTEKEVREMLLGSLAPDDDIDVEEFLKFSEFDEDEIEEILG